MPPTKRKSYTISEKLRVISQFKDSQFPGRKFAKTIGLPYSTLRDWLRQEAALQTGSSTTRARVARKIPRKCVGHFPAVDAAVLKWVHKCNYEGIRVKDRLIMLQGIQVRNKLLRERPGDLQLQAFKCSKIWCYRFKKRSNLCSRRHTTAHRLPGDFREKTIAFLKEVHQVCSDNNITRPHIINMDQVPRYYECDSGTTITTKGSREVLLGKASNNHKRFTFTPFIDASGRMLIKHALFSKLKNIPKHHNQCRVSVNVTGMWSSSILKEYIDESIRVTREDFNQHQNILIVLDSYAVHVQFVRLNSQSYKERGVFFVVIPPGLTGILQPLDVALNRPFQQHFDDCTNEYQAAALENNNNRTPKGNIRMPSTEAMTGWIVNWSNTVTPDMITKAFDLCGIVPKNEFDLEKLHKPLRDIYNRNVTVEQWIEEHSSVLEPVRIEGIEDWRLFEGRNAFFLVLKSLDEDNDDSVDFVGTLCNDVLKVLQESELTKEMITHEDIETIRKGMSLTYGYFEVYAVAEIYKIQLHLVVLNEENVPVERAVFGKIYKGKPIGLYIKKDPQRIICPPSYDPEDICFFEHQLVGNDTDESEMGDELDGSDYDGLQEAFVLDGDEAIDDNESLMGIEYEINPTPPNQANVQELVFACTLDVTEEIEDAEELVVV